MILERILCCECNPGKIFKNNTTYNQHLKSKRHINWASNNDIKNYKKSSVEYENSLFLYKKKLNILTKENIQLKEKIELNNKYLYYYLKNITILVICLSMKYSG